VLLKKRGKFYITLGRNYTLTMLENHKVN